MLILALTSDTLTGGQIYDSASTILQQKLLQVPGIGDVTIGGGSLPAVRVDLNPRALFRYGIGLEDVRAALSAANANSPKGALSQGAERYQIYVNDTARQAGEYRPLIVAYRDGAPVRLQDVATVSTGVEDVRNLGLANGTIGIILVLHRQPGANAIEVVDRVRALLPELQATIPANIRIIEALDRTQTIRTSLHDVERTLLIALALVVGVVFLMLRDARAALIPSVAVPLSLIGTFGVMYLLHFSLNNISLMALTIATGFVVDDAIVVVENAKRHIEQGMARLQSALLGAREVGFTVLSMSLSLIAVFLPILLMGGLVGRTFREFAVTLSVAILISLAVSLSTTPMMCAYVLRAHPAEGRLARAIGRGIDAVRDFYGRTLRAALDHPRTVMLGLGATVALNVYLFAIIPKGFFPEQDTGTLDGNLHGVQSISFQSMVEKLRTVMAIVQKDAAVANVVGFTGGTYNVTNTASIYVGLKPIAQRRITSERIIGRLRSELRDVAGVRLGMHSIQDIRSGARQSDSQFQYTILADSLQELRQWAPRIEQAFDRLPQLADVSSDQQDQGLTVSLKIDRATAARLGVNLSNIDNTLYDAFGQRQVSTIYNDMNQYHVVMEVDPAFWQDPETLKEVWISTSGGALSGTQATAAGFSSFSRSPASPVPGSTLSAAASAAAAHNLALNQLTNSGRGGASTGTSLSTSAEPMVPLAAIASYGPGTTPVAVYHQGAFVATTLSFNLPPGVSLGQATAAIERTMRTLRLPVSVRGHFAGTAGEFQKSLASEPWLILAAIIAVYIVLGILYESYVHPITILSTLPSAGVGAVVALLLFGTEFSLIALIGVILLIGIVKKNAIMMIDVAIETERTLGLDARTAIYRACLLRFRPIMMTTMAALFGAVPLAATTGSGAELRQPLGISIVGGLLFSQILTLYTTPVVYLYMDRLRLWLAGRRRPGTDRLGGAQPQPS